MATLALLALAGAGWVAALSRPGPEPPEVVFATYVGGCRGYQGLQDVAVGRNGEVWAVGSIPWDCDEGPSDALLVRFSPDGELLSRTTVGGHLEDEAKGIAVDRAGAVHVVGATGSSRCCRPFPVANPVQGDSAGGTDAFVARLDLSGKLILHSTFLGGSGPDRAVDVAVDREGRIYVAGTTASPDFPGPGGGSPAAAGPGGGEDAFLAVLDMRRRELVSAVVFGGSGDDTAARLALTDDGVYVVGTTASRDFPVPGEGGAAAVQEEYGGGASDAFVARFSSAGALESATFLGGSGREEGHGVAVGPRRRVHVVGSTDSADFPTVAPLRAELAVPRRAEEFLARLEPRLARAELATYLATGEPAHCSPPAMSTPVPCGAVAVDRAGTVFVTAPGTLATAVDGEGRERLFTLPGPGGSALALGAGGTLHVTGQTGDPDLATRNAYDPVLRSPETEEGWLVKLAPAPETP
ncbi:MAG: SBBP repeat-containing protein [Thermoanaerobaculia bacterium]